MGRLLLVLGDQLSTGLDLLREADPRQDTLLMAEVAEEAHQVVHHRQKLVMFFSAMRHFAARLAAQGWRVRYVRYRQGLASLPAAIAQALAEEPATALWWTRPGDFRLARALAAFGEHLPVRQFEDNRFIAPSGFFARWAGGRRQWRMEYFYRELRRHTGLLMEQGRPVGGRWNYDTDNRKPWRGEPAPPVWTPPATDALTREVLAEVAEDFADGFGELASFDWPVTPEQAEAWLERFLAEGLPGFGDYQDAMAEGQPFLFHSRLAAALNLGLLSPLAVCQRAEQAWREGRCPLNAAEGFIRQILGWREYVHGFYHWQGPGYGRLNHFGASRPLPSWYWSGATRMRCLSQAIGQIRRFAYGHHIQRLMLTGNFALLAGLAPEQVNAWYLGVYADALEWVQLPNTHGMALFADGGLLASKPYAAAGAYIQRMSDHCRHCPYQVRRQTGPGACPFNSLYWHFMARHRDRLEGVGRLALVYANWDRKTPADRQAILDWGERLLGLLERL